MKKFLYFLLVFFCTQVFAQSKQINKANLTKIVSALKSKNVAEYLAEPHVMSKDDGFLDEGIASDYQMYKTNVLVLNSGTAEYIGTAENPTEQFFAAYYDAYGDEYLEDANNNFNKLKDELKLFFKDIDFKPLYTMDDQGYFLVADEKLIYTVQTEKFGNQTLLYLKVFQVTPAKEEGLKSMIANTSYVK